MLGFNKLKRSGSTVTNSRNESVGNLNTKNGFKASMSKMGVGLQNLGKSLIYPIAVLPFAALLNRFGALAMELNPIEDGVKNAGYWIGFILNTPGKIVFDQIALLFAIGTAFGLSKDQRGEVALVSAVLYFILMAFLAQGGLAELLYSKVQNLEIYEKVGDTWVLNQDSGLSGLFYVPVYESVDIGNGSPEAVVTGGQYILNIGVLGGIVSGVTSAKMYNKFSGVKLHASLSFFGGRRFVPMIILLISVPIAFAFAIIWPWIQFGLVSFGGLLAEDSWAIPGTFIYAFLNRLAQPFGVHHIINTFLWFQMPIEGNVITSIEGKVVLDENFLSASMWLDEAIGNIQNGFSNAGVDALNRITENWSTSVQFVYGEHEQNAELFNKYFSWKEGMVADSQGTIIPGKDGLYTVMGDINAFQKGLISGTFQTGFFPLYWGGLTGAALAMTMAAPKNKRKEVGTFFLGVGLVAALTGIDEPLFFSFTFVAPILWMYNALFTAIFAMAGVAMHIHVGFGFSGGMIDYIISFMQAWGSWQWESVVNGGIYSITSNPLWLLAIAAVMFPVYYFSFYFTIKKMNLKTPGREEESSEEITVELKAVDLKSDDKYEVIAQNIANIVGLDNVTSIGHCSTRLRLNVHDNKTGTTETFRKAGAAGVVKVGTEGLQIIIGTDVEHVANAFQKLYDEHIVLTKNSVKKTKELAENKK
ncbi:PTS transporter subunit EIIC [Mesoplasma photuris]|uniref:PTS transporter subunit EIIC n=1 Tax=Mesoplasma photuris TaxID=217731 RepID=UPI00068E781F|nr:PTS transporter subunit EIIC [Mesoplasma photuris]